MGFQRILPTLCFLVFWVGWVFLFGFFFVIYPYSYAEEGLPLSLPFIVLLS